MREATMIFSFFGSYLGMMGAALLVFIGQILLGVSIKNDADALGLNCGTAFLILTIFFGGLPAAIYLAFRSNKARELDVPAFSNSPSQAKIAIILYVIGFALSMLCLVSFADSIGDFLEYLFEHEDFMF